MLNKHRPDEQRGLIEAQPNRLVQLAYRFVWNRADAEDAVQNAFALAQQKSDQLREPEKRWSWLSRIVVRQCLLLRRSETRRDRHEQVSAAEPVPESEQPPDRIEQSERAWVRRWAIEQLPPQQRVAVTLRHLEGMSYDRIAHILEIAPSTVRVHVRDAREAIREAVMKRYPEFAQLPPPGKEKKVSGRFS